MELYARQEPIYFKLPSSLKQDFDALCRANGYTKTLFLTNYIHEKVEERRKLEPKLFKGSKQKKQRTDSREFERWFSEL